MHAVSGVRHCTPVSLQSNDLSAEQLARGDRSLILVALHLNSWRHAGLQLARLHTAFWLIKTRSCDQPASKLAGSAVVSVASSSPFQVTQEVMLSTSWRTLRQDSRADPLSANIDSSRRRGPDGKSSNDHRSGSSCSWLHIL